MRFIYLSAALLALTTSLSAQSKVIDTIVICNHYYIHKKFTQVAVTDQYKLSRSPFISAQDELSSIANVNVQTRGVMGSQSDISIRGGTYEQAAVYMNGIRINNPQTGHNNSIIPISFQHFGQVTVAKSSASKFFGANAFSGAILLETDRPEKTSLEGQIGIGSFNNIYTALRFNLVKKNHWHTLSAAFLNSNGYRANTDNKSYQITSDNHFLLGKQNNWDLYTTLSINNRAFGANGFYSLKFPNQYEEIQSYFYNVGIKNNEFKFDLYWNQVNDYFLLKRDNPSFYRNLHYTDARGGIVTFNKVISSKFILNVQGEVRNEFIRSSNLGNRDRVIISANAHADWMITNKLTLNAGGNINYINKYDPFLTGGVNIAYQATKQHLIQASFNTAYRIPTFTELYYTSPTDSAAADLNPENGKTAELGYQFRHDLISLEANGFIRFCDNQIDWVKPSSGASYFRSQNISHVTTKGVEVSAKLNMRKLFNTTILERMTISYAKNDADIDSLANAKYSLNILKNQFIANLLLNYGRQFRHTFIVRYEQRSNLNYSYACIDTRLEYILRNIPISFYININNLTDTKYENFQGIPMPSVNYMAGIQFKIK